MNGPMLRALLAERFRLKFHRETREVPIYSLIVAKSGLKLQPSSGGSCTLYGYASNGRYVGTPGNAAFTLNIFDAYYQAMSFVFLVPGVGLEPTLPLPEKGF
jgi:uncharacterized protein (TIGR03435 family)